MNVHGQLCHSFNTYVKCLYYYICRIGGIYLGINRGEWGCRILGGGGGVSELVDIKGAVGMSGA